jgi:hypothetical protein
MRTLWQSWGARKAATTTKGAAAVFRFAARRLGGVSAVLLSMLREIFEESAYLRFLERQDRSSSPAAYAEFLRENETRKARRPRCC